MCNPSSDHATTLGPTSVLKHIVDVHCHPTDSIISPEDMATLPIHICAMATRQSDQALVRALASAHPDKVTPCFGHHPWFTHWIALTPAPSKNAHYTALLLPAPASAKPQHAAALERLLPDLPEPIPLTAVLVQLRADFAAFPRAMLGEVGLDRAARIPFGRPADPPYAADTAPRELSPFTIPLAHQLRNVSVHSVKSQQATVELLSRMKARYERRWERISVDLHSCGLSAETWRDIEKSHTNVFLSLSTVINSRSPAHRTLISSCSSSRILVESDYNDIRYVAAQTWDMLLTVADMKGWKVEDSGEEENWKAFEQGEHKPFPVKKNDRRKLSLDEWESDEDSHAQLDSELYPPRTHPG
ncbi:hypothetical protein B0H21DRAFT_874797 [Amylocystis lapponica]|nr:hypothetical protein B0H21DRAFT_874797 [Amylocystis lapponica]